MDFYQSPNSSGKTPQQSKQFQMKSDKIRDFIVFKDQFPKLLSCSKTEESLANFLKRTRGIYFKGQLAVERVNYLNSVHPGILAFKGQNYDRTNTEEREAEWNTFFQALAEK